jgi:hypothetical protein
MLDIAIALHEHLHFFSIHIETGHAKTGPAEFDDEG